MIYPTKRERIFQILDIIAAIALAIGIAGFIIGTVFLIQAH